jgi:hypothetical protein
LAYSLTLKMEATCSSETSVDFQRTTGHYIPKDRTLHNPCCEKLKSYNRHVHITTYGLHSVRNICGFVTFSCQETNDTIHIWLSTWFYTNFNLFCNCGVSEYPYFCLCQHVHELQKVNQHTKKEQFIAWMHLIIKQ